MTRRRYCPNLSQNRWIPRRCFRRQKNRRASPSVFASFYKRTVEAYKLSQCQLLHPNVKPYDRYSQKYFEANQLCCIPKIGECLTAKLWYSFSWSGNLILMLATSWFMVTLYWYFHLFHRKLYLPPSNSFKWQTPQSWYRYWRRWIRCASSPQSVRWPPKLSPTQFSMSMFNGRSVTFDLSFNSKRITNHMTRKWPEMDKLDNLMRRNFWCNFVRFYIYQRRFILVWLYDGKFTVWMVLLMLKKAFHIVVVF